MPIIADLSHSLGRTDIILPVLKAVKVVGADGAMIELHPSPDSAKSDGFQQLSFQEIENIIVSAKY